MKQTTGTLQTDNGLALHTINWQPDGPAKAVVVIAHGYAEHSGRYAYVAETLVANGYAVYAIDHRGHGKSPGLKAYFDSFENPINALTRYIDQILEANPETKLFLLGHSMGTVISLGYALKHQDKLAGLILSGTAITADENFSPVIIGAVGLLAKIMPRTALLPALPSTELSRDPEVVRAYDNDPLVYRGPWRVAMALRIVKKGQEIQEQVHKLTLPLLLMHGEDDKVVPISGTHYVYEHAASTDKTKHTYPEHKHEIFNELDKDHVIRDVVNWLENH